MKPELLAPAGTFTAACAAFQYGADAVYLGLKQFSARAVAENFTFDELTRLVAYAKTFNPRKRIYITLNTLLNDAELLVAIEQLAFLESLPVDGVIVQDVGLARVIINHFPNLPLHASTQMVIHNSVGAKELKQLGFSRVVTARELTPEENITIARSSGLEVEVFIHGALCYSISGLCLFSEQTHGRSGNKGVCNYSCREGIRNYGYPFSMRDLSMAKHIATLAEGGIASLKIEGRMKSPLYVATVCAYYRAILDGKEPEATDWQTVFARPTTDLMDQEVIDNHAVGHQGALIGTVTSARKNSIQLIPQKPLELHDGLQLDLPQRSGRPWGFSISRLEKRNGRPTFRAHAGEVINIPIPSDHPFIPSGTKVFLTSSQEVKQRYNITTPRESELIRCYRPQLIITLSPDRIVAQTGDLCLELPAKLPTAQDENKSIDAIRKAFNTATLQPISLNIRSGGLFAPISILNELRRQLVAALARLEEKQWRSKARRVQEVITKEAESLQEPQTTTSISYSPLPYFTRDSAWASLLEHIHKAPNTIYAPTGLATAVLLRDHGQQHTPALWSCYAQNSQAKRFWNSYGIDTFIPMPSKPPLFISCHSPKVPLGETYLDKRGRALVTEPFGDLYITREV